MRIEIPRSPSGPESIQEQSVDGRPFSERSEEEKIQLIDDMYHLYYQFTDQAKSGQAYTQSSDENSSYFDESATETLSDGFMGDRYVPMQTMEGTEPQSVEDLSIMQEALDESAKQKHKIAEALRKISRIEGIADVFKKEQMGAHLLVELARADQTIRGHIGKLDYEISRIERKALSSKAGSVIGVDRVLIDNRRRERAELQKKLEMLASYDTIGPMIARYATLKNYQSSAAKNRIVEFSSAKERIERIMKNLRAHQPYMLAGHLGSGKTEIARHTAKIFMMQYAETYFPGASKMDPDELYDRLSPEIFSASDEASVYDLVGKLKLTGKNVSDPELLAVRTKQMALELKERGISDVPEADIAKILLGQGSVTETVFNYGPLGRALRDGKPIIIDEINLAPAEVIGRINDILLRPVGSKFRLQENGEEEFVMKPGFTVISTLNLGGKYAGVKDFNAAFRSRWVGEEVDYPEVSETYDLILTSLLRHDCQRLPPDFPPEAYSKLIDLALVVRESQDLFSGKTAGQAFMNKTRGMTAAKTQLEKMVISPRDLMKKIIEPWRASNFTTPLEEVVAENILRGGFDAPDDQKFMTELFLRRGFFEGWDANKFIAHGVKTVSDAEINILHAVDTRTEFEAADPLAEAARIARAHTTALEERRMLRGNTSLTARALGARE